MATINDVAKKASVSVKTVSRLLSGFPNISPKTRERVEQAMKELEYFPSAAARAIRGQQSGMISLITDNLTTTPFSYEIVHGIQSVCEREGKLLLIGETGEKQKTFERLVERFREQKVEAIIKATFYHKPIEISQSFEHCPLVLVNCFDEQGRYPAILPDDEQGAYDITKRVIELGHENIAYITLPEDLVAFELRQRGFARAMEEGGIAINPDWVVPATRKTPEETRIWLQSLLAELLSAGEKPTVILCANDKMALRVIMQLRAMQIRIPEDVSVVGFDDFTLLSENTEPPLTTVSLPYFNMGVRAAELAIELSLHDGKWENASQTERCYCQVIPRQSDRRIERK